MFASKLRSIGRVIAGLGIGYGVAMVVFWTPDVFDKIISIACAVLGGILWVIGYFIEHWQKKPMAK